MHPPRTFACRRAGFWANLALLLWGVIPGGAVAGPAQRSADEYSIKAAFIYNLAKFVEWPPAKFSGEDSPVVVGVAGQEAFDKVRAVLEGKMIDKRPVAVRLVDAPGAVAECHIFFVARAQPGTPALAAAARAASVLSFGETDNFLDGGGMIRFYLDSDKLRLEIDNDAVRGAGLNIQSTALSTLLNKGIARLKKV